MSAPPAIHPQVAALLKQMEGDDGEAGPPELAAMRASYLDAALRFGGASEPVAETREVLAGGVPARSYRPSVAAEPLGVIVWLHGGGWVMGDLDGFDHVCRALANASGQMVVSIGYRLAPEHPFPAPVEDARAAVGWALDDGPAQLGYDAARVIVGGDSAGGNLAAVAARGAADRLAGLLLVYPVTDAAMETASYREAAGADVGGLTPDSMEACFSAYLQGADVGDPDVSPLRADAAGMPPAFVAVAAHDVLREDGVAFAAALQGADVDVELQCYEDMVHGFLRWGGMVDRTHELIGAMGEWSRARLA
ncbi:MAG: alpha/beta hydrolase [Solirubrobacterales bacterium]|nr:alpha/beta hydrolase [Solirubrobacterales bacterium]